MPFKVKNYYEILGLRDSANISQVNEAYYQLAKLYHPDHHAQNNNSDNNLSFSDIHEAHQILSDLTSKTEYDQFLEQGFQLRFSTVPKLEDSLMSENKVIVNESLDFEKLVKLADLNSESLMNLVKNDSKLARTIIANPRLRKRLQIKDIVTLAASDSTLEFFLLNIKNFEDELAKSPIDLMDLIKINKILGLQFIKNVKLAEVLSGKDWMELRDIYGQDILDFIKLNAELNLRLISYELLTEKLKHFAIQPEELVTLIVQSNLNLEDVSQLEVKYPHLKGIKSTCYDLIQKIFGMKYFLEWSKKIHFGAFEQNKLVLKIERGERHFLILKSSIDKNTCLEILKDSKNFKLLDGESLFVIVEQHTYDVEILDIIAENLELHQKFYAYCQLKKLISNNATIYEEKNFYPSSKCIAIPDYELYFALAQQCKDEKQNSQAKKFLVKSLETGFIPTVTQLFSLLEFINDDELRRQCSEIISRTDLQIALAMLKKMSKPNSQDWEQMGRLAMMVCHQMEVGKYSIGLIHENVGLEAEIIIQELDKALKNNKITSESQILKSMAAGLPYFFKAAEHNQDSVALCSHLLEESRRYDPNFLQQFSDEIIKIPALLKLLSSEILVELANSCRNLNFKTTIYYVFLDRYGPKDFTQNQYVNKLGFSRTEIDSKLETVFSLLFKQILNDEALNDQFRYVDILAWIFNLKIKPSQAEHIFSAIVIALQNQSWTGLLKIYALHPQLKGETSKKLFKFLYEQVMSSDKIDNTILLSDFFNTFDDPIQLDTIIQWLTQCEVHANNNLREYISSPIDFLLKIDTKKRKVIIPYLSLSMDEYTKFLNKLDDDQFVEVLHVELLPKGLMQLGNFLNLFNGQKLKLLLGYLKTDGLFTNLFNQENNLFDFLTGVTQRDIKNINDFVNWHAAPNYIQYETAHYPSEIVYSFFKRNGYLLENTDNFPELLKVSDQSAIVRIKKFLHKNDLIPEISLTDLQQLSKSFKFPNNVLDIKFKPSYSVIEANVFMASCKNPTLNYVVKRILIQNEFNQVKHYIANHRSNSSDALAHLNRCENYFFAETDKIMLRQESHTVKQQNMNAFLNSGALKAEIKKVDQQLSLHQGLKKILVNAILVAGITLVSILLPFPTIPLLAAATFYNIYKTWNTTGWKNIGFFDVKTNSQNKFDNALLETRGMFGCALSS